MKVRADKLVVEQHLAESLERAQAFILAGIVIANDQRVEKPSDLLEAHSILRLKEQPSPYVSRGGLKLKAALEHFSVNARNAVCLDIGASTGGFTDCLLQHGAKKVYAVDVGYNQLAWSLRQDPRVVVIERLHARDLTAEIVPEKCDIVVCDVSFIALHKVLPYFLPFAAAHATLITLIKPQFEVEKRFIGKGGIVTDVAVQNQAVENVVAYARSLNLQNLEVIDSPILGTKGNKEFLLYAKTL